MTIIHILFLKEKYVNIRYSKCYRRWAKTFLLFTEGPWGAVMNEKGESVERNFQKQPLPGSLGLSVFHVKSTFHDRIIWCLFEVSFLNK
jgi:hypothetical protein